jgi:hypothetical protein
LRRVFCAQTNNPTEQPANQSKSQPGTFMPTNSNVTNTGDRLNDFS